MVWDSWSVEGDVEMTEHWRSVVPDLSVDAADDRTGVANDRGRVAAIRQRYVLELKHLTGRKSVGHVTSSVTRLSDWSPLTPEERLSSRPDSPFALACGVPSGLANEPDPPSDDVLDFALLVFVAPPFLPRGALFLHGVPLVIARHRPVQPLTNVADDMVGTPLPRAAARAPRTAGAAGADRWQPAGGLARIIIDGVARSVAAACCKTGPLGPSQSVASRG